MLNSDERDEREGLLRTICALLEDRIYDHDLRKLLGTVAVDRHLQLHSNLSDEQRKGLSNRKIEVRDVMSFTTCTDNFCQNVNKQLKEFKKPEFITNSLILQSMESRYRVDFQEANGTIKISLKERGKEEPKLITPSTDVMQ